MKLFSKLNFIILKLFVCVIVQTNARTPFRHHRKPNIVFFMGDDIGYNDVGWNNRRIHTPYMNQLAKDGIILDNHYATPFCTPSRSAFMTGRYPQELGLQRFVLGPQEPYGVPLSFPFVSEVLKCKGNYATHAIGKWHLGYCNEAYTPTRRGFDSFLGFYTGGQENYFHCSSKFRMYRPISNCTIYDFRDNLAPGTEYTGQYSTYVYSKRAVEIIKSHRSSKPLFLYISLTDAHFPLQAPKRFEEHCQDNQNSARKNFCAAMAAMDEAITNVTEALKEARLYANTIIVFASDNGGSGTFGGNNYPLRGDKGSLWEGGTRVPAFVHSALLKKRNHINKNLFHMVDWFPTFLQAAAIPRGSIQLRGVGQWFALNGCSPPVRYEFPYTYDVVNGTIIAAIRVQNWKLIAGPGGVGDEWTAENETTDQSFNSEFVTYKVKYAVPFDLTDRKMKLFNLKNDPYERNDVACKHPYVVKVLLSRLNFYRKQARPAVKMAPDPAGNPEGFGNFYSTGWCKAYFHVPSPNQYTNQNFKINT